MKTLHFSIASICLLLMYSCSSDDSNAKGYFPIKIELTDYNNDSNNRTVEISYNSNNTIAQITLEGSDGVRTKNYSYTNGRITNVTNVGFLGGPDNRTFIYNSSGILSSIVDETDDSTETFLVNYDAPSNTYTLIDGTDASSIQLDASGNPIRNSTSLLPSDLNLTLDATEKGVFEHLTPQIALQFDLALFSSGHIFYYFNQKQINQFEFGIQDIEVINNRDSNGTISSVIYNFIGGGNQIDITYQKRNL